MEYLSHAISYNVHIILKRIAFSLNIVGGIVDLNPLLKIHTRRMEIDLRDGNWPKETRLQSSRHGDVDIINEERFEFHQGAHHPWKNLCNTGSGIVNCTSTLHYPYYRGMFINVPLILVRCPSEGIQLDCDALNQLEDAHSRNNHPFITSGIHGWLHKS